MNTSKMLLALVGMGTAALVGCASESADETSGGADAVSAPSTLQAKITSRQLSNYEGQDAPEGPGCHVALVRPVVEVTGKADVTRKITTALEIPASVDAVCSDYLDPEEPEKISTIDGSYVVGANGVGLLSLSIGEFSYVTGTPHPNAYESRFTFDLRNGSRLYLSDILQPAAVRRVQQTCLENSPYETDAEKLQACGRLFIVEREGIRVFGTDDLRWDPEGTLVPWNDIRNDLKKGVVKDFAANPPAPSPSEACESIVDDAQCSANSACEWFVRPDQGEGIGSVCVPK